MSTVSEMNTPPVGGAKKSQKSRATQQKKSTSTQQKKSTSTQQKKSTSTQQKKSTSTQQKKSTSTQQKSSNKRGGALVEDIKNLAVPFAILLAKEGLEGMFKKTDKKAVKKTDKKAVKKNVSDKPASLKRRKTIAGGACGSACGSMHGGASKTASGQTVKNQFDNIAKEIEHFLQKY